MNAFQIEFGPSNSKITIDTEKTFITSTAEFFKHGGSTEGENFSFKGELPACSHPPCRAPIFWRTEGGKQAAFIFKKNSHFYRTPVIKIAM